MPIILIAPRPYLIVMVFLLAIVGAANSVEDVALFTLFQRIVPDEILTRVLGVVWGLAMGAVAIGSIAAPAIAAVIGPRPAFVVVGSILPLLTLLSYRRLLEIDRTARPAPELALIDRVPMFAPLSVAAKERLAAHLLPLAIPAGEVVIRAGDPTPLTAGVRLRPRPPRTTSGRLCYGSSSGSMIDCGLNPGIGFD